MKAIDADKLLDILKEERDKAILWRDDCAAFEDTKMMVANQVILTYNKMICLINGMDVINVGEEKPVC